MMLQQMKMELVELYVGYYRVNATSGKTWKEYAQSEYIRDKAKTIFNRMGNNTYTVHIPRWLSHLGTFYAKKDYTRGENIFIYRMNQDEKLVLIVAIPVTPLDNTP